MVAVLAVWLGFALRHSIARGRSDVVERDAVNVAIHRDQKEHLLSEVDVSDQESLSAELDLKLLDELDDSAVSLIPDRPANRISVATQKLWYPFAFAGFFVIVVTGMYWFWFGNPGAIDLAQVPHKLSTANEKDDYLEIVSLVEKELASNPENYGGWYYLISLKSLLGDFEGVERAHAAAENAGLVTTETDAAYLRAAFALRKVQLSDHDLEILVRVEQQEPMHLDVLQIKLFQAVANNEYVIANRYAEQILRQPVESAIRALIDQVQRFIRARLGEQGVHALSVDVALESDFREYRWLTLITRPRTGPPVSVIQRPIVGQQRFILDVDDSTSMVEENKMSVHDSLQITARLSATTSGIKQPEDVELVSDWIDPKQTRATSFAFKRQTPNGKVYFVVSLSVSVQFKDETKVFVIVRKPESSGPPIAVKVVDFGELPIQVEITDQDVMLEGSSLDGISQFEVVARASVSGGAIRQIGDIESQNVLVAKNEVVELSLDSPVESIAE